jgi:hypothetical protein
MLPRYAARVEDLGPRGGLIPAAKVLDLKGRFRCSGCGRKGQAVVSVKWRGEQVSLRC